MKLTVTHVSKVPQSSGVMWIVRYSVDRTEGESSFDELIPPEHVVFIHAFPEERILSLAQEYGLDSEDMDTLMDVLLSEPFMNNNDTEPRLFSGASREAIKEGHLRRSARAKLAVRMSTRGIRNPIEMIRSTPVSARAATRLSELKGR